MTKLNTVLVCGISLAVVLTPNLGLAQIGGVLKKKSAAEGGGGDLAAQQEKIVSGYSAAGQELAKALGLTLEAMGKKDAADNLRAKAKECLGKTDKTSLSEFHKALGSANEEAAKDIAENKKLSEEQKAKVKESLTPFGKGLAIDAGLVALTVEMTKQAQEEVKSNPLAATKFAPALYVGSVLPGDVKAMGATLNNYMKLAKDNDIEVPKDATVALGKLD